MVYASVYGIFGKKVDLFFTVSVENRDNGVDTGDAPGFRQLDGLKPGISGTNCNLNDICCTELSLAGMYLSR